MSRDEDSPQSLAGLATKDGLIAFAGINSSTTDQRSGNNAHFRSFSITYPTRGESEKATTESGDIIFTGKSTLFSAARTPQKELYQRLLRLSPVHSRDKSNKRIGAIATGLASEAELIIFDATTNLPNQSYVCARLKLDRGQEAADLDLFETSSGKFQIAYCTDHDIYFYGLAYDFGSKKSKPYFTIPKCVHSLTSPKTGPRAQLRCLRWLGPNHLILLLNNAGGKGAQLLVVHIDEKEGTGQLALRKDLPPSFKSGISLAICLLDADPADGQRQILVAVAGKDVSVHVFTMNYNPTLPDPLKQMGTFRDFCNFNDVHATGITKLVFSNFFTPRQSKTSNMSVNTSTQYIQLASVALGGTVVVDTFALTSDPTSPSATSEVSGKHMAVRWVLSSPHTERFKSWVGLILVGFVVLIFSITMKMYMEMEGDLSNALADVRAFAGGPGAMAVAARRAMHEKAQGIPEVETSTSNGYDDAVSVAEQVASSVSHTGSSVLSSASASVSARSHQLRDLVSRRRGDGNPFAKPHEDDSKPIILISPHTDDGDKLHISLHGQDGQSDVNADLNELELKQLQADKEQGGRNARPFEQLAEHEKQSWKHRLEKAGQWSASEGEVVLKGVLFSEYAGVVGGALRDAILN